MLKENRIDKYLNELLRSGSDIKEVERLKKECLKLLSKDRDLSEITEEVANKAKEDTQIFLYNTNKEGKRYISGISSCIYLPDFEYNDTQLTFIGGHKHFDIYSKNDLIDSNTIFDVASITKLFTLILAYECETLGLNLNTMIKSIDQSYNLEDFSFNDLIRLCGEIATQGRINDAKSKEEAYHILKTAYLKDNSRMENKYTDLGAMIIGDTLTKVLNVTRGVNYTLDEWMKIMIFEPLEMNHTTYNPNTVNITGCGKTAQIHDPKARKMEIACGHAGIFTNSEDLCKLANGLFRIKREHRKLYSSNLALTKDQIGRIGEVTYPNAKQCNKGNLGVYVKHPEGFNRTFTPSIFSMGSFSHQGWTGSVATFDPNNLIHQNILVNAIYETNNKDLLRNDKIKGFGPEFDKYLDKFTIDTMLIWVAKRYYDDYVNIIKKEDPMYTKKIYKI